VCKENRSRNSTGYVGSRRRLDPCATRRRADPDRPVPPTVAAIQRALAELAYIDASARGDCETMIKLYPKLTVECLIDVLNDPTERNPPASGSERPPRWAGAD
jgi:hypothetical protein